MLLLWLTACGRSGPFALREIEKEKVMSSDQSAFHEALHEAIVIAEKRHQCRIGVSLRDPSNEGLDFSWRGDELFHAASTMKVPVMIEVFRQVDAGKISLTETMRLDPTFSSMIDDSPYEVAPGKHLKPRLGEQVTVLELIEQMIVVSDNLATNLLLTRVRPARVTAAMRAAGVQDGYVLRCLMDIPAFEAGVSNRLTADGLTRLMAWIDSEQAASPASCQEMMRILEAQEFRDLIPAGVGPEARVGNKTGSITGVAHDTAIVHAPGGVYYLTIMTDGLGEKTRGAEVIAPLSRQIYEERLRLVAESPQPQ
jgi:beta-lactamase class A